MLKYYLIYIMELESKLLAYRAKKNREAKVSYLKESFKKMIKWNQLKTEDSKELQEPLIENITTENQIESEINDAPLDHTHPTNNKALKIAIYLTGFLAWASLYYFFIKVEFGIIYLIISALFGIYFNTRTGPKDEGEVSAYSVFNKNCESINGTLKAEQFEREIRFGAL